MDLKLYILVSKHLSKSQRAVQACHSVAGWLVNNPGSAWKDGAIVILSVDEVDTWSAKLTKEHFVFREPYWNNLATALCSPYIGEEVKDLSLA